jgi:hypothetical protein
MSRSQVRGVTERFDFISSFFTLLSRLDYSDSESILEKKKKKNESMEIW